jgi:hypothetical protein|nr:hypothetical protein [uncultured Aggregatibacter sp.]
MYDKKIPESMNVFLTDWQYHSKNSKGSRMLTFLATLYFNIFRYPSYEDRILSSISRKKMDDYISGDTKLEDYLKDFKKLYETTQEQLNKFFPEKNLILLTRRITVCSRDDIVSVNSRINNVDVYNTEENPVYMVKDLKEKGSIKIDMDILNSWATVPSERYGMIALKKEIKKEDIIYFNHINDSEREGKVIEKDEYIVVNREPTGVVCFKQEDVEISSFFDPELNNLKYSRETRKNEINFLDNIRSSSYYMYPFNGLNKDYCLCQMLCRAFRYWWFYNKK